MSRAKATNTGREHILQIVKNERTANSFPNGTTACSKNDSNSLISDSAGTVGPSKFMEYENKNKQLTNI
jgi:hypothetical protein